jgi:hypothetical protein
MREIWTNKREDTFSDFLNKWIITIKIGNNASSKKIVKRFINKNILVYLKKVTITISSFVMLAVSLSIVSSIPLNC